ncbi:RapZ C-terminal domain-containing protein [Streptomyces cinereoruber]|uniref:RapZ C-terminal domain-containing protein n=1 Tax=Streptomyces cinereoruber TaxID=67260 RepID=UPI00364126AA
MQITHLPGRGLVAAVVSSIGVRHDGAHDLVTDGLYLDLRHALRNPADDPAMRYRTGLDADVYAHVLATPGALELILRTVVQLRALADEVPVGRLVRLTMACQGGRHRTVDRASVV